MKTLLLASTALVATAGIAAAEVSISGYAEIGVIGGDRYATFGDDDGSAAEFHTDIDVTFAMTGESDGGLAFGATVDLDENGAFDARSQGGETYFLSYGAMRLDMGDTDGALDAVMRETNVAAASIADDETEHSGFNGNSGLDGLFGGQVARASYSAAGFTAALSVNVDDAGKMDPVWGLGVRYVATLAGLDLGVGLGYQTQSDTADIIGLSLDTKFANGLSAAINYSQADIDGGPDDATHMGIGFGYTMNALSVGVNYGEYSDWTLGCGDCSGYGIAATYDLGGGLAAHLGYGASDDVAGTVAGGPDEDSYSFGLSMSF
ncbi:porin [Marivita sp.]|uniref:porin n=1 Tax=Marivita sp. TaxID=2003365 RepID=UPI003F72A3C6